MSAEDVVTSKPTGDYALNTVQNPELLEVAYRAIQAGAKTESVLEEALAIDSDTVGLITSGLRIFNLGGKSDFEYELTSLGFEAGSFLNEFRLHILNSVASEANSNDWGLQSAVLLNLEYLLKENETRFVQSDEGLIKRIDDWHVEQGYEPQSSSGRMELNRPKFSLWTNQATYLGLLHGYKEGRKNAYTVRFDPDLVRETIEIGAEQAGEGDGINFNEYLKWLSKTFIRVPITAENAIPKPFARTLYELVRNGKLKITKSGDPTALDLPGIPAHENIAKTPNYLRI